MASAQWVDVINKHTVRRAEERGIGAYHNVWSKCLGARKYLRLESELEHTVTESPSSFSESI